MRTWSRCWTGFPSFGIICTLSWRSTAHLTSSSVRNAEGRRTPPVHLLKRPKVHVCVLSSGPCFFLSCPVTVDEFRSWFIDLWNHSIIPYLQEGAKDGIKVRNHRQHNQKTPRSLLSNPSIHTQLHGQKAVWEDPVEWVRGTLPWPSAQQDQAKLFHLPPPSIGSSSPGQPCEERPHKETPPSSMESDPLVTRNFVPSQGFLTNASVTSRLICCLSFVVDGDAFETSRGCQLHRVPGPRRPEPA